MDLVVVSTGHKYHKVDSQLAALLLELHPGNLQRIGDSNTDERELLNGLSVSAGVPANAQVDRPRPGQINWSIEDHPQRGLMLQMRCLVGNYAYRGDPDNKASIENAFIGHAVPAEILERYSKAGKGAK